MKVTFIPSLREEEKVMLNVKWASLDRDHFCIDGFGVARYNLGSWSIFPHVKKQYPELTTIYSHISIND